jgi:hypothetical protein
MPEAYGSAMSPAQVSTSAKARERGCDTSLR